MLSPSMSTLPTLTIGTNVGLSMSTSLSSGLSPFLSCAVAVAASISAIRAVMNILSLVTVAKIVILCKLPKLC